MAQCRQPRDQEKAYLEGHKAGGLDRRVLKRKSQYAWNSAEDSGFGYAKFYGMGYRDGWTGKKASMGPIARGNPIDYDRARREAPRLKAMLTRAGKDPVKVKAACLAAMDAWDAWGAWPDNWSTWERALGDSLPWNQAISLEDLQRRRSNPSGSWVEASTHMSNVFNRNSGAGRISTIWQPRKKGLWQWAVKIDGKIVSNGNAANKTHAKGWCDSTLNSWASHRKNPASDGKCYVVVEFEDGTYKTTALPAAIGNHLMEHSGRTWSVGQKKQRHSKNAVVDRWLTAKFLRPIRSWDWDASKDQERSGFAKNPSPICSCDTLPAHTKAQHGAVWSRRVTNAQSIREICPKCSGRGWSRSGKPCSCSGGRRVKRGNPTSGGFWGAYYWETGFGLKDSRPHWVLAHVSRSKSEADRLAREEADGLLQIGTAFPRTKVEKVSDRLASTFKGLGNRINPSLGLPGMPHTWIAPNGAHVRAGDQVEYWRRSGLPYGASPVKTKATVLRMLVFDDHVQVKHGPFGDTVDASNFIRLTRKGNEVL